MYINTRILHPPQKVILAYRLPSRHPTALRHILPPLQTYHRIVSGPRQVFTLLVQRNLLGNPLEQLLLFLVVPCPLLLRHCGQVRGCRGCRGAGGGVEERPQPLGVLVVFHREDSGFVLEVGEPVEGHAAGDRGLEFLGGWGRFCWGGVWRWTLRLMGGWGWRGVVIYQAPRRRGLEVVDWGSSWEAEVLRVPHWERTELFVLIGIVVGRRCVV